MLLTTNFRFSPGEPAADHPAIFVLVLLTGIQILDRASQPPILRLSSSGAPRHHLHLYRRRPYSQTLPQTVLQVSDVGVGQLCS